LTRQVLGLAPPGAEHNLEPMPAPSRMRCLALQVEVNLLPRFPELVSGLARGSRQESILVFARHLANMPHNALTFLDMHNCGIDTVGAQHLATQLMRNTVLRTLVLQEVPLPIQEVRTGGAGDT
jgi:hypothetical protein